MNDYRQSQDGPLPEEASSEGTDLLSGSEIDDLLNAIDEEGDRGEGNREEGGFRESPENGNESGNESISGSPERTRRVKIYDFLRPDRFTSGEIELLAELGNDYAVRLQNLLPPSLRDGYTVRLSSVDQLRADEYSRGLGNTDTIALLTAPGYPFFYLEFSMSAMRLLLSGLIGMSRPLSEQTSIPESFFFRRLVEPSLRRVVLPALSGSWKSRACFPYTLQRIVYSPTEIRAVSSYEMFLILFLEMEGPEEFEARGSVAIPHRLAEELVPALGGEAEGSFPRAATEAPALGSRAERGPKAVSDPGAIRVLAQPEFPLFGVSRSQLETWRKGSSIRLRAGYPGRYI